MINLDSDRSIVAVMPGAPETTQPQAIATYADETSTGVSPQASAYTDLNGTTEVTVVAAPSSGTTRMVKELRITNIDTDTVTVSVALAISTSRYYLAKSVGLAVGATLVIGDSSRITPEEGITGLSGDGTTSGSGIATFTISDQAVTYAKIQNVSATSRFLGRKTAGAGSTEEISGSEARTILGLATTDSPTFKGLFLSDFTQTGAEISSALLNPVVNTYGISNTLTVEVSANNALTSYGQYNRLRSVVNTGITHSGIFRGFLSQCLRNSSDPSSDDNGTLTTMYGLLSQYGNSSINAAASPQTTTVYGLYLWPFYATGVIQTLYDIYLASGSTGGTITNRYAIYQESANAKNYFAGNIGLGATGFGTAAAKVLAIASGTAPTSSPADMVQMYCKDFGGSAGRGTLHLRTEDGDIIGFGAAAAISNATTDTSSLQTAVNAILAAMRANGLVRT